MKIRTTPAPSVLNLASPSGLKQGLSISRGKEMLAMFRLRDLLINSALFIVCFFVGLALLSLTGHTILKHYIKAPPTLEIKHPLAKQGGGSL